MLSGPAPEPFLKHFTTQLAQGPVLDCGCGRGRNSFSLSAEGFRVCGIDNAALKITDARQEAHRLGMTTGWVLGDAGNLPFGSQSFGGAICTHVLEELDSSQQKQIVQELWRVLRSGGRLMVVTAARDEAMPEGAEAVGENAFLFRSQGRETVLHMSSREQLLDLFGAFRVDELVHVRWDVPQLTPIRAHWVLMASRQSSLATAE